MQRLQNLQMAQRGQIEGKEIASLIKGDAGKAGGIAAEMLRQVMQERSDRANCGATILEPEPIQAGNPEVIANGEQGGFRAKHPVVVPAHKRA